MFNVDGTKRTELLSAVMGMINMEFKDTFITRQISRNFYQIANFEV